MGVPVARRSREADQPPGSSSVGGAILRRARLGRILGRGWHSLRRKFADDNDVLPLSQVMAGGGWKSGRTITETYQAPDLDKLRVAMEQRAERRVQKLAATTTTNYNQPQAAEVGALQEVAAAQLACVVPGWVAEWFKAHAWKVCVRQNRTVGSNPTPSVERPMTFSVGLSCFSERILGDCAITVP